MPYNDWPLFCNWSTELYPLKKRPELPYAPCCISWTSCGMCIIGFFLLLPLIKLGSFEYSDVKEWFLFFDLFIFIFNLIGCGRSQLLHVRSSSLTRNRTQDPCIGSLKGLATGPPGKSREWLFGFSLVLVSGLRTRRMCAFLLFFFSFFDEKEQGSEKSQESSISFPVTKLIKLIFTFKMNVFASPSCCLFGDHLAHMWEPLTGFHCHWAFHLWGQWLVRWADSCRNACFLF